MCVMDTSEDIEELLHCDEEPDAAVDLTKQCSTCLKKCDTQEEKDRHEDTSDRGGRRVDLGDGQGDFDVFIPAPDVSAGWQYPEALDLFLKEGSLKRVLLKGKLEDGRGLNGITHDILYQTLCFMVDWALVSGEGMIDTSGQYGIDPTEKRKKCELCAADSKWVCEKCKRGAELCKCKRPKECTDCEEKKLKKCKCIPKTNKVLFSPVVSWACVKCDRCDFACECGDPIKCKAETRHHDQYFEWVKWRAHMEKTVFSSKEDVKVALLGRQQAWLSIGCALKHHQDTRHKSMQWMFGIANHLGVQGRWQWTEFQVSVSALLQAIDMLLMILALPTSKLNITPGMLPYVGMMCLMLQVQSEDECHIDRILSRMEWAMPREMKRSTFTKIHRTIWTQVFQFVLPGQTIGVDTSSMRWMKPNSSFQDQEDCVAGSIFQLSDHVPRLDNKTLEERKVACPFYIRTPRTMIIRPNAYVRLFQSYIDRQKWIIKSNRL